MNYIIANSNSSIMFDIKTRFNNSNFYFIDNKQDLNKDTLQRIKPRYVFFPHWSFHISEEIFKNYECIVFHMTDLPFGRGGSPLQNLIERGVIHTKISAIKVIEEVDAGPIYLKNDLCLLGNAEEIFIRASFIISTMIELIIKTEPIPFEQQGELVIFKRRTPDMSNINKIQKLEKLYDQIRMLDGDGYPNAFLENDYFKFEFSRASLKSDKSIIADVRILKK